MAYALDTVGQNKSIYFQVMGTLRRTYAMMQSTSVYCMVFFSIVCQLVCKYESIHVPDYPIVTRNSIVYSRILYIFNH